ncbi:MAG: DUF3578 domain-containing protein [Sphingomonadaceae bacterium]
MDVIFGHVRAPVRKVFQQFVSEFPREPVTRDGSFGGHPLHDIVERKLVEAVSDALGSRAKQYDIRGSIGQGDWTQTPWVVLLDPAVTTEVGRNYYVVYLLSHGADRLYLAIAQGCTSLKDTVGIPKAKEALRRRASVMRARVQPHASRLSPLNMDLNVAPRVWRGKLYEAGCVLAKQYDCSNLPPEEVMVFDLAEALDLYGILRKEGGWTADDDIVEEATEDEIPDTGLEQVKRYRQHRTIERDSGHSKEVKKRQGTRCSACALEMSEVYGVAAEGIADAHHLTPLGSLDDGAVVTFDPIKDFAVLCPSCHRAIHRMEDPSDIEALKVALNSGVLSPVLRFKGFPSD